MRRTAMVMMVLLLAVACAREPARSFAGPNASNAPPASGPALASGDGTAWRHLALTGGVPRDGTAAQAVESQAQLAEAWTDYGFDAELPAVDFDNHVVLLLVQPDDACLDTLIGLDVVDGELRVKWLAPPGMCAQPLIMRLHAVEVHRGHVPARFEVALDAPFETEADPATIELAPFDGAAPPAPEPPAAMTDDDVDTVFEGHAIRRCKDESSYLDGDADGSDGEAIRLLDRVIPWLKDKGLRADADFMPFISRTDGVRAGVIVNEDRADEIRSWLDDEFGVDAIHVYANRYDFAEIQDAQRRLNDLMGGGGGPGTISSTTGIPGPVEIGMIDPTREALDRIAEAVDPALVCVAPELSGVSADVGVP